VGRGNSTWYQRIPRVEVVKSTWYQSGGLERKPREQLSIFARRYSQIYNQEVEIT
jgi:hypothetical protein